jgi:hypothetical protein
VAARTSPSAGLDYWVRMLATRHRLIRRGWGRTPGDRDVRPTMGSVVSVMVKASPAWTWVEVAIGATECAGFVPLAFVVDHEATVVEGQPAPEGPFHGRSVLRSSATAPGILIR